MVVDHNDDIAETDEDNNEYSVPAGARLRLAWAQFVTHYYPRSRRSDNPQEQTVSMGVRVGPMNTQSHLVAEWTGGPFEVERGEILIVHPTRHDEPRNEVEFYIAGDEALTVLVDATMKYRLSERYLSWGGTAFFPDDEWGVGGTISEDEECGGVEWTSHSPHRLSVLPPSPWQSCGPWGVDFVICRVE